jgi:NAD(P)-dependent dehydrogenase (short-subunit alcohol dehydrogenase family)
VRSIVTGAARGLGEGIATRLVADGAQVALVDVDDAVQTTAARIQESNSGAVAVGLRCDVSSEEGVDSLVASVVQRFGGIDLLVNNAGVGAPRPRSSTCPLRSSATSSTSTSSARS